MRHRLSSLGASCVFLSGVSVMSAWAGQQTLAQREAQAVADNPAISKVESVRYLGTFIESLADLHGLQEHYDGLANDDFVGRMAQLRVMAAEADVAARGLEPFTHSESDNIKESAAAARDVCGMYKGVFEQNVKLYEQMVRIFTIPHELTESESQAIAEGRISTSKLSATFTEASDLLKTVATLAFASVIVPAPGDHIALDMSAAEKAGFIKRMHRDFGALDKQKTLRGPDIAAFVIMVTFDKDWLLSR
jgi:hypothetical protein